MSGWCGAGNPGATHWAGCPCHESEWALKLAEAEGRAERYAASLRHLCNVYGCTSFGRTADHGPEDCAWCEAEALLPPPEPARPMTRDEADAVEEIESAMFESTEPAGGEG